MGKRFPEYAVLDDWRCFDCGSADRFGNDASPRDCGYPDGKGRYRLTCGQCGLHTYFDMTTEEACDGD